MSGETIEAFGRKWKRVWAEGPKTWTAESESHESVDAAWERLFGDTYPGVLGATDSIGTGANATRWLVAGRVLESDLTHWTIYVPASVTADEDPYTAMVREFHQRMGLVVRDAPSLGTPAEREERVRLMLEELLEVAKALNVAVGYTSDGKLMAEEVSCFDPDIESDPAEVLHELADLQATVSGTAVQFGLPLLAAVREVHRANMEKQPQGSGRKPLKPDGWKPADVSRVLDGSGGEL